MLQQDFNILINGQPFQCVRNMTIHDLLSYLLIDMKTNLVEHNNEILDPSQFKTVILQEHDKIEIITLVGGG
uniref:Thiamin biosynthesis protein S n=1 Tax=Trichogloeopsis pedicellata TaxID=1495610 RepID=A0A1G4P0T7_9FLOR|nr:Thiamin biosynthesis protein S [Trichogloeopsis pedicellata]SCW24498.1 Thiamin biosynthesis protein S [Trichogloeopsis pedicellata]